MAKALERLESIFDDVFGQSGGITRETTAADVRGWDSLAHLRLLVHVEREFRIRFTSSDMARLRNVGDLVDFIDRALREQAA